MPYSPCLHGLLSELIDRIRNKYGKTVLVREDPYIGFELALLSFKVLVAKVRSDDGDKVEYMYISRRLWRAGLWLDR